MFLTRTRTSQGTYCCYISYNRIEEGPQNFVKQDHEEIMTGDKPQNYIILKPYTYALITDPIVCDKDGKPVYSPHGQVKVRLGDQEIRTDSQYKDPFPLYPGEKLSKIDRLTVIPRDCALKVRANCDFVDSNGNKRQAGDEWQVKGPCIYVPRIEEDKVQLQEPIIVDINKALRIRAKYACEDIYGNKREAGEEWLIRDRGQYMLGVNEVLVEIVSGIILTDKKAIHLTATRTFTDFYGEKRKAGEEWLITKDITSVHICDVYEKVVSEVSITVLCTDEYCYLLNPRKGKENKMGRKVLIAGPCSFFLKPGEVLDGGIKKSYILTDDEALLLTAYEDFTESTKDGEILRKAGERWMVKGPRSYIPLVEIEVIEKRHAIPMDTIEGIYVRDTRSGTIRAQCGKTYMLNENEELAHKTCTDVINSLLKSQGGEERKEPYKLVTYKCPFNAAVQVYDYKEKKSRVVFGPNLVALLPDEQFTVTYLSGKTPKVPGRVKTLHLLLGPAFSTDVVEVDTSDHARLEIKMSYNWRFRINPDAPEHIFNVRDFIGDLCKAMGSKVRAAVATVPFEIFHKSSTRIIRSSIFGYDKETDKVNDVLYFNSNGLEVFNVDIQSIEPKDKRTKQSLDKTVTQAIEITTRILEQEARRQADKSAQEEKGKLECLILDNKATVEKAKKALLQLKAKSDEIKSKGQALAEAKAKATAEEISAQAEVSFAELKATAKRIRELSTLDYEKEKNLIEYEYQKNISERKIATATALAQIESGKFSKIMEAIGTDTLVQIAKSGPEMQAQMLSSLGLQGYMLMDSKNPINLFTAANGMIASGKSQEPEQSI
eukprot:TRINITY_DN324_c0_g1_i2.p2 TRINITY_DN324_c0_g1~~TRINITY_DN324_c0_g1_i2.p2  ORF type:complete len:830 (+),score=104.58 TRINITY_DN324_c0_g1_i2:3705-6194(+)